MEDEYVLLGKADILCKFVNVKDGTFDNCLKENTVNKEKKSAFEYTIGKAAASFKSPSSPFNIYCIFNL